MNPKVLEISLVPFHGSRSGVMLRLSDLNGTVILESEMNYETYGMLVSGRGINIDVSFWNIDHVGMKHEFKREMIVWDPNSIFSREDVIKPYEIDGWKAYREDLGNFHMYKNGSYEVRFGRFVEP